MKILSLRGNITAYLPLSLYNNFVELIQCDKVKRGVNDIRKWHTSGSSPFEIL